jgi:hypothetical protein
MFAAGAAPRRWLASMFATGDATGRCLTFMLSSMTHLVDDSHMDDDDLRAMAITSFLPVT